MLKNNANKTSKELTSLWPIKILSRHNTNGNQETLAIAIKKFLLSKKELYVKNIKSG